MIAQTIERQKKPTKKRTIQVNGAANGHQKVENTAGDTAQPYLQQLAAAAEQGSERLFLEAKQKIDWNTRPAEDFTRAIRWALASGAYLAARNLSNQGAALYPENQELQKLAYLLAPPKVIRSNSPPDPTIRFNYDWLKTHRMEYLGQWVALQKGILLATAPSFRQLTELVDVQRDILFTKVF